MLEFLISALRAVVEMLGLCLLAQGVLYFLAGSQREANPLYRLFSIIGHGPRHLVAQLLPARVGAIWCGFVTFAVLLFLWLILAFLRKLIDQTV